jgi:predicted GH43/DUF377 family glycosyl hydrolase
MQTYNYDKIILSPFDIDLNYSPLKNDLGVETYVLGAFNPGMSRLPNGNIILLVRIAEAIKEPEKGNIIRAIRWEKNKGFRFDEYAKDEVDTTDPRKFELKKYLPTKVYALTSISWILPVELNADGSKIVKIHYDKIISPSENYQEYGVEDARITKINGTYYVTTCSVSSERQCTTLYTSGDGLNYKLEGIILDHQNKDMLIFEGKINNKYYALTRPLGGIYFATPPNGNFVSGPSINMATSPDLLHWKPSDKPFMKIPKGESLIERIGGGAQPIFTQLGWLILFHAVEKRGKIGIYRTFWALLDVNDPQKIIHIEMDAPLLEANARLTDDFEHLKYIHDVVFTTGIVEHNDNYIIASGELDLCCRITHIPKSIFSI